MKRFDRIDIETKENRNSRRISKKVCCNLFLIQVNIHSTELVRFTLNEKISPIDILIFSSQFSLVNKFFLQVEILLEELKTSIDRRRSSIATKSFSWTDGIWSKLFVEYRKICLRQFIQLRNSFIHMIKINPWASIVEFKIDERSFLLNFVRLTLAGQKNWVPLFIWEGLLRFSLFQSEWSRRIDSSEMKSQLRPNDLDDRSWDEELDWKIRPSRSKRN